MWVIPGPRAVVGMDDTVWPPPGPSPACLTFSGDSLSQSLGLQHLLPVGRLG